MAERGSIVMDIRAQVSGYEQSLRRLQMEFQKVDPGSQIGKSLSRAIQAAETQVKALNKNLTPRVTNETQIDNVVQKVNTLGESIQTVVRMMQTVTDADLTSGAFGSGIQQFQTQIQSLEAELEGKLATGIHETIQNFYLLRNTFERVLNVDITDKSPDELLQILSESAKTVSKDLAKVNREIEDLETNIASKEATKQKDETGLFGTFASRDQLRQQVEQYTQEYEAIFADLRERLTTGLTAKLGDGTQTQTFINDFFRDLTPDNLKDRIISLYDSLSGLGTYTQKQKRQFYKEIFGFDGKDILHLIQDINLGDPAPVIEKFKQFLDTIASEIGGGEKSKIVDLLSDQDINAAADSTIRNIDSAFRKVQTRIQKLQDELTALLNQKANKVEERRDIEGAGISIESARVQIENELKNLREQNADLQKQIDELNDKIRAERQGAVDIVHHNAEDSGKTAEEFDFDRDAAQKYKNELQNVIESEKMLGKVEGVVERWFSIYAVIRMVGNAIKSMIATIKELDKTITEIAIVTKMDQSQLWDQMGQYTQVAREYAASISGVYKVSQLYYQQGLEQADVMALTTETLKMARISGLDYAEATDYMTNAIRSFKMEMIDAQRVVDVYSAIAASSATNVTELAKAMSKTASSAEAVGSSFESTTAMMAVMIEATRESAENIGSALKSIISRYGEMKADPSKLIDSEGEAMSLNKVDTALQTVGISIHDATGQFRDFDDVIMELSEKWNTIDKNTQRYIATIMAGNRQQSRFLALVSSYDRLKELSAEAADSEDAAQLQYLKTLDSVDAKIQQLQTSIQSLYVSSGLEKIYKWIIDAGTSIINNLNNLNTWFKLPIPAIAAIGSAFWNLTNVVHAAFTVLKAKMTMREKEIRIAAKLEAEQGAQERIVITENEMAKVVEAWNRNERQYELHEQNLTRIHQNGVNQRNNISNNQSGSENTGSWASQHKVGLSIGGSIASLVFSGISSILPSGSIGQGISNIASTAASGFSIGATLGHPIIGTIFGTIFGFIQNINNIFKSADDKIKLLQEEAEKAKNTYIQKKSDTQNLATQIEQLRKLEKARYDSKEAEEEYYQVANQMAETYPGLIESMDEAGNVVIDLKAAEIQLTNTRYDSIKAAKDAAKKAAKQAEEEEKQSRQKLGGSTAGTFTFNTRNDKEQLLKKNYEAYLLSQRYGIKMSQIAQVREKGGDLPRAQEIINDPLYQNGITQYVTLEDWEKFVNYMQNNPESFYGTTNKLTSAVLLQEAGSILLNQADAQRKSDISQQVKHSGITINTSAYFQGITDNFLSEIPNIMGIIATQAERQMTASYANNEGIVSTEDYDKFIDDELEGYLIRYQIEWNNFWNKTLDTQGKKDAFVKLLKQTSTLSEEQFRTHLTNTGLGLEAQDSIIEDAYKDAYNVEDFKNRYDNKNGRMAQTVSSYLANKKLNFFENLGSTELLAINDIYDQFSLMMKSATTNNEKQNIQRAFSSYLTIAQKINTELPEHLREQAEQIWYSWDGTLSNFFDILTQLKEIQGLEDIDEQGSDYYQSVEQIKQIPININTELNSYIDSLVSQLEDFEKALSKVSKGMDAKDAMEIANKLKISISEFNFKDGKFFFKDVESIQNAYINYSEESFGRILTEANKKIEELKSKQNRTDDEEKELENLKKQIADIEVLKENYVKYQTNTIRIQNGQIKEFLEDLFGANQEVINISTLRKLASGKITLDELDLEEDEKKLLSQYLSLLTDTFRDVNKNFYEGLIKGLEDSSEYIKVENVEEGLIEELSSRGIIQKIEDGVYKVIGDMFEVAAAIMQSDLSVSSKKDYIDTILKNARELSTSIIDEITNLSSGKEGEFINITYLQDTFGHGINTLLGKYGIAVDEGFAQIQDNSDITGAIQALMTIADSHEVLLASEFAELQDTVLDLINDLTKTIEDGISGSLGFSDANNLNNWFKNNYSKYYGPIANDLDFTETADGLKLTFESALQIYDLLSKMNDTQAAKVFDKIKESVIETNEHYKSVSDNLNRIKELNDLILKRQKEISSENSSTTDAKIKQYEQELKLAQEILAVRSTTEDASFSFMSNKIPGAQNNPLNYYSNWITAWTTLQEQLKNTEDSYINKNGEKVISGFVDYDYWYNLVTEMNNIAALGGEFEVSGVKLDGSLEAASKLIQKGASSLVATSDGELKVALNGMAIDFTTGTKDFENGVDTGIKALAESQIKMLDGMIRLLEVVVQMENLGDITGGDNTIDLKDLFPQFGINPDTLGELNSEASAWISNLFKVSETNKDLYDALNSIKIGDNSIGQLLKDMQSGQIAINDAQLMAELLDSMWQMYLSGDYDLNDIFNSIKSAAGQANFTGSIALGDVELIFTAGEVITKDETGKYIWNNQKYDTPDDVLVAIQQFNIKEWDNAINSGKVSSEKVTIGEDEKTISFDGDELVVIDDGENKGKLMDSGKHIYNNIDEYFKKKMEEVGFTGTIEEWKIREGITIVPELNLEKGISQEIKQKLKEAGIDTLNKLQQEAKTYENNQLEFEIKYGIKYSDFTDLDDNEFNKLMADESKSIFVGLNVHIDETASSESGKKLADAFSRDDNVIPIDLDVTSEKVDEAAAAALADLEQRKQEITEAAEAAAQAGAASAITEAQATAEALISKANTAAQEAQAAANEAKSKLDNATSEVTRLTGELANKQNELASLTNDTEAERNKLESDIVVLKEQLAEATTQQEKAKQEAQKAQALVNAAEQAVQDANTAKETAQTNLTQAQSDLTAAQSALQQSLNAADTALDKANDALTETQTTLETTAEDISSTTQSTISDMTEAGKQALTSIKNSLSGDLANLVLAGDINAINALAQAAIGQAAKENAQANALNAEAAKKESEANKLEAEGNVADAQVARDEANKYRAEASTAKSNAVIASLKAKGYELLAKASELLAQGDYEDAVKMAEAANAALDGAEDAATEAKNAQVDAAASATEASQKAQEATKKVAAIAAGVSKSMAEITNSVDEAHQSKMLEITSEVDAIKAGGEAAAEQIRVLIGQLERIRGIAITESVQQKANETWEATDNPKELARRAFLEARYIMKTSVPGSDEYNYAAELENQVVSEYIHLLYGEGINPGQAYGQNENGDYGFATLWALQTGNLEFFGRDDAVNTQYNPKSNIRDDGTKILDYSGIDFTNPEQMDKAFAMEAQYNAIVAKIGSTPKPTIDLTAGSAAGDALNNKLEIYYADLDHQVEEFNKSSNLTAEQLSAWEQDFAERIEQINNTIALINSFSDLNTKANDISANGGPKDFIAKQVSIAEGVIASYNNGLIDFQNAMLELQNLMNDIAEKTEIYNSNQPEMNFDKTNEVVNDYEEKMSQEYANQKAGISNDLLKKEQQAQKEYNDVSAALEKDPSNIYLKQLLEQAKKQVDEITEERKKANQQYMNVLNMQKDQDAIDAIDYWNSSAAEQDREAAILGDQEAIARINQALEALTKYTLSEEPEEVDVTSYADDIQEAEQKRQDALNKAQGQIEQGIQILNNLNNVYYNPDTEDFDLQNIISMLGEEIEGLNSEDSEAKNRETILNELRLLQKKIELRDKLSNDYLDFYEDIEKTAEILNDIINSNDFETLTVDELAKKFFVELQKKEQAEIEQKQQEAEKELKSLGKSLQQFLNEEDNDIQQWFVDAMTSLDDLEKIANILGESLYKEGTDPFDNFIALLKKYNAIELPESAVEDIELTKPKQSPENVLEDLQKNWNIYDDITYDTIAELADRLQVSEETLEDALKILLENAEIEIPKNQEGEIDWDQLFILALNTLNDQLRSKAEDTSSWSLRDFYSYFQNYDKNEWSSEIVRAVTDRYDDAIGRDIANAIKEGLTFEESGLKEKYESNTQETPEIDVDTTAAENTIETLIEDIEDNSPEFGVNADTTFAENAVATLLNNINDSSATIGVNIESNTNESSQNKTNKYSRIDQAGGREYSLLDIVNGRNGLSKGNVAFAKGTLMGELGPELYVSGGRYFVAGQNGAEMVNLPDDAIVFNHLQTKQLLTHGSTGRGKPTTNEKNAVSFAKGGPAQASASSALATLKQLRAEWQAIANLSVADLASQAGSGGGGGGDDNLAIFIKDVERWYNWLQKIARLEEQITYQEQLRSKIQSDFAANGKIYYNSQKQSLKALEEQAATASSLAMSQEEFYKKRMRDLENSPFARFYEFDEFDQIKYKSSGFTELSQLLSTNDQGLPNYTAEQQYNWLIAEGYADFMKYDSSGQEIKMEDDAQTFYSNSVQAFFDRLDAEKEELQGLHDSVEEQKKAVLEKIEKMNELIKEMRDNQKDVENSVLKAIEDSRKREIDELSKQKEAISESANKLIDGLTDSLEKERKLYENNQADNELNRLRRQLSILQRSGGSAAEIASLQNQIDEQSRDQYFDKQQEQIDAVKEASDKQIERMDTQIELMNETLEYQKANGLLWGQVYEVMSGNAQEIAAFVSGNDSSFWASSPLASTEDVNDLIFKAEKWVEFRDDVEGIYDTLNAQWGIFQGSMKEEFGSGWDAVSNENKAAMKQIFDAKLAETGDYNEAAAAARQSSIYQDLKKQQEANTKPLNINNTTQAQANNEPQHLYKVTYTIRTYDDRGIPLNPIADENGNWFGTGATEEYARNSAKWFGQQRAIAMGLKRFDIITSKTAEKIYKNGGLIDYTGPAWVDGTKQRPESIWDAETTKLMKDNLLNSRNLNLLGTFWDTLQGYETAANHSYSNNSESLVIENAVVNMNVASIANDYDARRAGEQAMEEMLRIARKTRVSNF